LDTLAGVVKSITPADPVPVPAQAAQEGLAWRWDESESEGVTRLREVSARPLGFSFTFSSHPQFDFCFKWPVLREIVRRFLSVMNCFVVLAYSFVLALVLFSHFIFSFVRSFGLFRRAAWPNILQFV
jgi:hypothetical protein